MFQLPTKVSSEKTYLDLFLFVYLDFFVKSLPWPIEIRGSKISFYRNIAKLCAKMSRVTWALTWINMLWRYGM